MMLVVRADGLRPRRPDEYFERADGVLRVIELGDGQVSDRAATTSAHALVAAILAGLNSDP